MSNILWVIVLYISFCTRLFSQEVAFSFPKKIQNYWIIGSYNIENLFDFQDSPDTEDNEFLPYHAKRWDKEKYERKLKNLSEIISEMHPEGKGPDILGLIEVENKVVLQDLIATDKLKPLNYEIVHYDSPDKRGIDVALIFKTESIKLLNSKNIPIIDETDTSFATRDILHVELLLGKCDTLHCFVNHWPSKRGGEESEERRIHVAQVLRGYLDELYKKLPTAKVVIMGDFNDAPSEWSLTETLKAKREIADLQAPGDLWNAMSPYLGHNIGTHFYKHQWSILDQFIVSKSLIENKKGARYHQAVIFNPEKIREQEGPYKGAPLRTYVGTKYMGGYSDHFPILLFLTKK